MMSWLNVGENIDADVAMPNKLTRFPPLIIALTYHSTSSTQVVRVLHHEFPLQRIVACVYTVTIPSGPCGLAHYRRALVGQRGAIGNPRKCSSCILHQKGAVLLRPRAHS